MFHLLSRSLSPKQLLHLLIQMLHIFANAIMTVHFLFKNGRLLKSFDYFNYLLCYECMFTQVFRCDMQVLLQNAQGVKVSKTEITQRKNSFYEKALCEVVLYYIHFRKTGINFSDIIMTKLFICA